MAYRFEHDPESGAFYVRLREGEYAETIPLSPGLGAGVDVDERGKVLGLEFLGFEEYAEAVADAGGALEIPERIDERSRARIESTRESFKAELRRRGPGNP